MTLTKRKETAVLKDAASTPTAQPKPKSGETWWIVLFVVSFIHLVAILSLFLYTPKPQTWILTVFTWIFGGFGITMGYHRLWSHRAFKAHWSVRLLLAIAGTMAFQGSARWWTLRHRLHHRYTDTEHDPYDATRGFWYSHMGWLFEKPYYTRLKWIDSSDLDADIIVRLQNKYFPQLAILLGFVIPTWIASFWGDALGGFLYGGYVARIVLWHVTWAINSFAHMFGDQDFSTENTSRGNLLLALVTHGEGHHNYHHEFPRDYRNGIAWFDWDPTKWMISLCSRLGLAYDLVQVSDQDISKARISVFHDKVKLLSSKLEWTDEKVLPVWTIKEFETEAKNNNLLIIDSFAVDVSSFKNTHPGGASILEKFYGQDATKAFYGVLNNHTRSARQIVQDLRVARIQ